MTEKLLRRVLIFYAYPGNWTKPFGKLERTPRALRDSGRLAKAALRANHPGAILCTACDILDIALTELGRKCGVSDPRMAEIARGKDISEEESDKLLGELDKLFDERFPKHSSFL